MEECPQVGCVEGRCMHVWGIIQRGGGVPHYVHTCVAVDTHLRDEALRREPVQGCLGLFGHHLGWSVGWDGVHLVGVWGEVMLSL